MQFKAQGPPRASEWLHPYLDCLFLFGSSAAKMWTVPWSLETQMREASWLKLILQRTQTVAGFLLGQTHSPGTDSGQNVQHCYPTVGLGTGMGVFMGNGQRVSLLLEQPHLCPGCPPAQQGVVIKLPLPLSSPQFP